MYKNTLEMVEDVCQLGMHLSILKEYRYKLESI